MKYIDQFEVLDIAELSEVEGGVAPVIFFFMGVGSGIAGTSGAIFTLNKVAKLTW